MKHESGNSEIEVLAQRVATARGKLPLQTDPALFEELSEAEIAAERELAEWIRAQRRRQRRHAVVAELSAEKRDRRVALAVRRADDADVRWHRRALAARRRVSNPDARLAQLYRRAEWTSRALIGVVVLGMLWAGVNVQHNLVPSGDMRDPLYWLSYGFEAMISIPIIAIMVVATTAARWGREIARGKVVFLETALLGVTIALNAGPHLVSHAPARAAEAAVAPVMVGVVIWLHAWVSARYAQLIDGVPVEDRETPPATLVSSERADLPADPSHITELPIGTTDSPALPTDLATQSLEALSSAATHNGYGYPLAFPTGTPPAESSRPHAEPVTHNGHPYPGAAEPTAHNGYPYPTSEVPATRNGHTYPAEEPATRNGHIYPAAGNPATNNSHTYPSATESGTGEPTTRNGHAYPAATEPAARNGHSHAAGEVPATHADHAYPATTESGTRKGNPHPAETEPAMRDGHAYVAATGSAEPTVDSGHAYSDAPDDVSRTEQPTDTHPPADSTPDLGGAGKAPAPQEIRPSSNRKAGAEHPFTRRPTAPAEQPAAKSRTHEAIERATQLVLDDAPVDTPPTRRTYPTAAPIPDAADITDEIDPEPPIDDSDDIAAEIDDVEVWAVAREISERRLSRLPVEQLAEVLTLADESWTPAAIGASIGLPGSRILGILEAARRIRRPYAIPS
ncbi:hypothetical protein [Nocardia sp. NPDC051570]|uniref:hypothetical protein n=1 Tax=Nocardia sp. NPDC051570 TaxID=3364324 RepID=UPI0037A8FC28